jgi:hypothetical protein
MTLIPLEIRILKVDPTPLVKITNDPAIAQVAILPEEAAAVVACRLVADHDLLEVVVADLLEVVAADPLAVDAKY